MPTTLIVKTQFSAVDKFSATMKKMTASVSNFANKAVVSMNIVDRAMRKVGTRIKSAIGKFGQLGLAVSAAAILMTVFAANKELDQNLASLSAITGVTGEKFKAFEKQINLVSKSQKKFAGETAKAFEIVGSAKPELLADAAALGKVTEASIILSKATGADLAVSADNLTGTLNQFNLTADESTRVINALAAGSQAGSAPVDDITASMKQFGTVAASLNVSVEESVGLIETLAEKNIKGAEAGTKIRNVLTKMATIKALPPAALKQLSKFGVNLDIVSDKTLPISKRLKELSKIGGDATAMFKVFGAENLVAGQVLLENTDKVDAYTKAVTGTNIASEQAAINSNTLANRWDELVASFKNATTSTNSNNKSLGFLKNTLAFLAKHMDVIITVVIALTAAFAAFKIVMLVVNAVMYASPITWIVAGILLLIGVIALLIIYWEDIVKWVKESDSGFAKLIRFAIKPLIILFKIIGAIIDWLVQKWEQLVNWVKTSDSGFAKFIRGSHQYLISAFKLIGDIIDWLGVKWNEMIDWVKTSDNGFAKFIRGSINPLIKAFELLGNLWDNLSGKMDEVSLIGNIQDKINKKLGVNVIPESSLNLLSDKMDEVSLIGNIQDKINKNLGQSVIPESSLNPDATIEQTRTTREEKTINKELAINITDGSGLAEITKNQGLDVNLTKTTGWQK
ncbi:MAG: phage tail tape measure protein [Candidatus Marinimicrobia bacterium]|nr:phage tail tape measure protein [Candidatus Neomarinimicrobiota bacterium]